MVNENNNGYVLMSTLAMLAVVLALTGAYFATTRIEFAVTRHSKDAVSGFYAAEAGLNLRAEEIRGTFVGYSVPTGTSPVDDDTTCLYGNKGSGDFVCKTNQFGQYTASTFVIESPSNPITLTIPPSERYQNLNAQEFRYTVSSVARDVRNETNAALELRFKNRLVPLFQFAAFYDKDLEILPGPKMTLEGPVHTNGDLYLNADASFDIQGQVTTAGKLYRGRKDDSSCASNPVRVPKAGTLTSLIPSCTSRRLVTAQDVAAWNGMIQVNIEKVTVPGPEMLDPLSGGLYWDKADLRLVLHLNSSDIPVTAYTPSGVEIRKVDNTVDTALTTKLASCAGNISGKAAGNTKTFYNNREKQYIRMLEIDMRSLLNCIHNQHLFGPTKDLGDSTESGIVFHFSIDGPYSNTINTYGVRISNANPLRATVAGAAYPIGMTIVTNQAAYTKGDFNKSYKIPAAIMADSYNVLSGKWNDSNSNSNIDSRIPTDTTVNAALLSGTDSTGGKEGASGQGGYYNGGLENYPRFHENWDNRTLTYAGSFVSLGIPRHVNGRWVYGNPQYKAPVRDWHYDTTFNDSELLPPISPRFVYLRQELFVRNYEQ